MAMRQSRQHGGKALLAHQASDKNTEQLAVENSPTFVEGCRITWAHHLFLDEDEQLVCIQRSGIISRITAYYVVIRVDMTEGRWLNEADQFEQRFDKRALAERVKDAALREIILESARLGKQLDTSVQPDYTPYTIYALTDPLDQTVHYVGMSRNVHQRYRQHCQCEGLNLQKNIWVIQLLQRGLKPVLTILERVEGRTKALEQEQHWIQHYLALNAPLTNCDERGQPVAPKKEFGGEVA